MSQTRAPRGAGVAVACLVSVSAAAQSPDPAAEAYLLEYSTIPMLRQASVLDASGRLLERGTSWLVERRAGDLLTRRSPGGFLTRLGKWVVLDFPILHYTGVLAHEYGHVARVEELGLEAKVVVGSPWWGQAYYRILDPSGLSRDPLDGLRLSGGGLEGASVLADRVEDRVYTQGVATPADLTLLVAVALDTQRYVLQNLSDRSLSSPEQFLRGEDGRIGDPRAYAVQFTAASLSRSAFGRDEIETFFPDIQRQAHAIRRGSLIDWVDYGLVTAGVGLFRDYLWHGQRHVRVRWLRVGRVSLVPSLRYHLSPLGPERQIRVRYKLGTTAGSAYARWTRPTAPGGEGLAGAGGELQGIRLGGLEPKLSLDVWRNPDRTASARVEVVTTLSRLPRDRLVLSLAVGAKGRGHLLGFPTDSGAYVHFGGGLRF